MAKAHTPKFHRRPAEERRRALTDAALRCLLTKGPQHTSVRAICAEAGVSIGLLSHYYASKEDVVADAYRDLADRLMDGVLAEVAAAPEGDARARLSAFIRASFAPAMLNPELLRLWIAFWWMSDQSAEVAGTHAQTYGRYRRTVEGLLADLTAERERAGKAGFDIRLAAIGFSALLDGLWLEWCLDQTAFTPQEAVALCEDWIDGRLPREAGAGPGGQGSY